MPARAEKMPVEAHATGPIARGGSGGHASRRTISGSARSICREVPLWYPRARDGTATVCSMARARLPNQSDLPRMGVTKKKPVLLPTGVAREEFRWYPASITFFFRSLAKAV